jgi:hypothetical protein
VAQHELVFASATHQEVHLASIPPRCTDGRRRQHRERPRRGWNHRLDEAGHEIRLEPQLLWVGDVLPGTTSAWLPAFCGRTEMSARRLDAMRGRPEHGNENGDHGAGAHRPAANAHVFSRDSEWNSHHAPSVTGNAVTGGVEREDLDVDQCLRGKAFVIFALRRSLRASRA